ncbi:DUF6380 family protein [Streptomyces sp. NPDC020192]|uniref:DUF6380 family protein n=1 Tax=Streptomyces sp. NPDC020192 TaxID=3365066 RepID=UPI00379F90E2
MDLTEPGDTPQATLCSGVASLTATAERAPFTLYTEPVCSAPKGRGELRDQPRRVRGGLTAHHGTPRGAFAGKDAR